jgi:hypothetical protein
MCIQCLGHFSPLPPAPSLTPPIPRYQAETILPLSLVSTIFLIVFHHIAEIAGMHHNTRYWLRWGFTNFCSEQATICDPPDLSLLSSWVSGMSHCAQPSNSFLAFFILFCNYHTLIIPCMPTVYLLEVHPSI